MRRLLLALLLLAAPALAGPRLQRGRLADPDGRWLADREVRLVTFEATERVASGRTGADGRFAIDVAPLGSEMICRLVVGPRSSGPASTVDLELGDEWPTIRVPRLPVVAGRLVDARGAPLARAPVAFDWTREPDLFTDDDGRFELEMPVGGQSLGVGRRPNGYFVDTVALRLVEGQGRVALEVVVDDDRRARLDVNDLHGLRLERIGGDAVWGPPWDQDPLFGTSDPWAVPGEYRVHQLEGSAMMGPGTHPLRSWTVTLRPGPNALAPPAGARLAIPCLVELDGVPEPGPEERWLEGWSHPLEPPPLDEAAFRRWPLHELADESNMRYHGQLLGLAGVHSDTQAAERARAEAASDDDDEAPVAEAGPQESLVAHLPGPGAWGLTLAVGREHAGLQVKLDDRTRWTTVRARWARGDAALALVAPARRSLAYPDCSLRPLLALLVDAKDVVRWARPFDGQGLPLEVRGLAPGRYRLLWAFDGFRPREAKVELAGGKTLKVVLDPF